MLDSYGGKTTSFGVGKEGGEYNESADCRDVSEESFFQRRDLDDSMIY